MGECGEWEECGREGVGSGRSEGGRVRRGGRSEHGRSEGRRVWGGGRSEHGRV